MIEKELNGWVKVAKVLGNSAKKAYVHQKAAAEAEMREAQHRRAQRRHAEENLQRHGVADWPGREELQAAGLLGTADELGRISPRICLGSLEKPGGHSGDMAFWNGKGHMLTVAPTRTGKGAAQIIPTLLRYPGSCVVVDPKGENFDLTAGWRHKMGSRILRLAPLDPGGETDAFNPLETVKTASQARAIAEMLVPREAEKGEGKFFEDEAINFLTGLILYQVLEAPRFDRTLGRVRELVTAPADPDAELVPLVRMMAAHGDHTIRSAGQLALLKLHGAKGKPDMLKAIRELFRSLDTKMAVWSEEGMRRATRHSDFHLEHLKDDIVTVYLQVPFENMKTHGAFLRVFFTSAVNAMLQDRRERDIPVLFLVDEFPAMGRVDILAESISYLYGCGVRIWLFAQALSDLAAIYPDRWKAMVSQSACKMFWDADGETARFLSELLHDTTIMLETIGLSESMGASHGSEHSTSEGMTLSSGYQYSKRALMTPYEVEQYTCRKRPHDPELGQSALVFARHLKFGVARPYWFLNSGLSAMGDRGRAHLAAVPPGALREVWEGNGGA